MNNILVRTYRSSDAPAIAALYYNTVHNINIRDYSEEQVNVWAPYKSLKDYSRWQKKLKNTKPFVGVINKTIVGFAEFELNGEIDCFYVHHEYQGKGVGSALIGAIFKRANQENISYIFAEVSITARQFFERKGFTVVREQAVNFQGVKMNNFVMEKHLNLAKSL